MVFFTSDQLFIFTQQNGLCTFDAYGDSDELYSIIPLSGYENDVLLGIIRMVGDDFDLQKIAIPLSSVFPEQRIER